MITLTSAAHTHTATHFVQERESQDEPLRGWGSSEQLPHAWEIGAWPADSPPRGERGPLIQVVVEGFVKGTQRFHHCFLGAVALSPSLLLPGREGGHHKGDALLGRGPWAAGEQRWHGQQVDATQDVRVGVLLTALKERGLRTSGHGQ